MRAYNQSIKILNTTDSAGRAISTGDLFVEGKIIKEEIMKKVSLDRNTTSTTNITATEIFNNNIILIEGTGVTLGDVAHNINLPTGTDIIALMDKYEITDGDSISMTFVINNLANTNYTEGKGIVLAGPEDGILVLMNGTIPTKLDGVYKFRLHFIKNQDTQAYNVALYIN